MKKVRKETRHLRKELKGRHAPRTPSIERAVTREVEKEEQRNDALYWADLFGSEDEGQPVAAAEKRRRITGKAKARRRKSL
jgi:DNA-binding transcriptional regulator YdaS (Cro superfamily)